MAYYDIIGDVHGCANQLKALLGRLGYFKDESGVYRHPDRIAVFVGDLIDRGEEQLEVLQLVKPMVDAGSAHAVMGNHEFNAICWATNDPETGEPIREHSPGKRNQHKEFLKLTPEDQAFYVDWFKTLPLWLDLGGIRVVHACWHEASMAAVRKLTGSDRLLTPDHFAEANREKSDLNKAIEVLLKGPEIPLGEYDMEPFRDPEAKTFREEARIKWWDHDVKTMPELAELRGFKLNKDEDYRPCKSQTVEPKYLDYVYKDRVPLFYGHYWREWDSHKDDWTTYTACVDFRDDTLVAYRWNGEPEIHWRNYIPHDPQVIAETPSDVTV